MEGKRSAFNYVQSICLVALASVAVGFNDAFLSMFSEAWWGPGAKRRKKLIARVNATDYFSWKSSRPISIFLLLRPSLCFNLHRLLQSTTSRKKITTNIG